MLLRSLISTKHYKSGTGLAEFNSGREGSKTGNPQNTVDKISD